MYTERQTEAHTYIHTYIGGVNILFVLWFNVPVNNYDHVELT